MSLSEFEGCLLLTFQICIMLYCNNKYERNYILQSLFILIIPWFAISIMQTSYIYQFGMIIFDIIINWSYISFRTKK